MDKKARDAAIEREADERYFDPVHAGAYIQGTNSVANAEWIVRRTIELARKPVTRILAQILKELGER